MSALPFLDAATIRSAVPIGDLLDAVEQAYRDVVAARDRSPLRTHVAMDGGDLLLMPGVRSGAAGSTVKLVTVMSGNAARGLPTVQAVVVWFDAETGTPMALMDGGTVTAMRTGAASGVATRLLARTDAGTLAVFGAGGQAEWQIRAVLAARPRIGEVRIHTRTEEGRSALASRLAVDPEIGADVRAGATAREALDGADVVCAATTSTEPVFDAAWIGPGTHVNGIGAFRLGMVELPPDLFARAEIVAVDARAAALAEAGDVVAALQAGLLAEDDLVEIGRVEPGWADTRDSTAITAFKSVGLAIQDVAAAELIASRLLA